MPQPTIHTLDNGLTVALFHLPHARAAHVAFSVQAGPRFETPETNGISHFMEHMLFRGCGGLSTTEQAETFADLGADPDPATGVDTMTIDATVPKRCLGYLLDLLGSTVTRPRFEDFEAEREVILEELADNYNDKGVLIDTQSVLFGQMFPRHPEGSSGMPIVGTIESVARFTPEMLAAEHRRLFVGGNAVLSIAGNLTDITPEGCLARAQDAFSLPKGPALKASPFVPGKRQGLLFVPDSGPQTAVTIGVHGVPWTDPSGPAAYQFFDLLGDGDTSRLWKALRGRRGLAYDMMAEHSGHDIDPIGVCAFTCRNEQAGEATRAVLDTIARVLTHGVYAHEITRLNLRRDRRCEMIADEPQSQSGWYGIDLVRAPAELLGEQVYLDRMGKVSPVDVQAVARRLFSPERLFVSVVGATGSGVRAITEAVDAFSKSRMMS